MKPEILLIEPMLDVIEARLDEAYVVHRHYAATEQEAIAKALPSIRAVVTGGGTGLSNDQIDRLPALGIIAINGVGTDKVDLVRARGRDIDVTTTPDVLTDDVADTGIALMLAVLRHIAKGDRFVREGCWALGEAFPLGTSPKGKRLGILGLGQIGRALGRRAEAFGMTIGYWNRSPQTDTGWTAHATPTELAASSDVLAVCVAANASTQDLVNSEVLEALGPKAIVINIARGSVLDEDALIQALRNGTLAGAGLDVFVGEPRIREDFFTAPNTVLMPHQGSATRETRIAMGEIVLANLQAFFNGEKPPTTVN
ncbi:2-hydroxyacid dehydrogenase [Pseudorhizobium halotolerans]|uniref:2-hydroxyacid dehydrogenase n=1 Tax=Pseudorhizobium halotolerans TaxID=1233081 RepID=A0ABM8PZA6_9HYPH|nr:2-hydroxyacid dehydrogenase [Pseudorhizobium halotolerans]CAD7056089.1 2-hydroxyacid dehydrogenase [Pseudorhizobium halotolerans]